MERVFGAAKRFKALESTRLGPEVHEGLVFLVFWAIHVVDRTYHEQGVYRYPPSPTPLLPGRLCTCSWGTQDIVGHVLVED